MKQIKRNQLAELIVDDGQPVRAMLEYFSEAMELLDGMDIVTEKKVKMDSTLFISSLSCALKQMCDNFIDLEDLIMIHSYADDYEADFCDESCDGYMLSTSYDENGCNQFVIKTKDKEPFLASIFVEYDRLSNPMDVHLTRFKRINRNGEHLYFSVSGTCGDVIIEYNKQDLEFIKPLDVI